MPVVINDSIPVAIETFPTERRRLGRDRFDKVWAGVPHIVPTPDARHGELLTQVSELLGPRVRRSGMVPVVGGVNVGDEADFRVPDFAALQAATGLYHGTAALVLEIVDAGDETLAKVPFYAVRRVEELILVDADAQSVSCLRLCGSRFAPEEASTLLDLSAHKLIHLLNRR